MSTSSPYNPSSPCNALRSDMDLPTSSGDIVVAAVSMEMQDINENCRHDDELTPTCQSAPCQYRTSGSLSGSGEVRSGSSMAMSGSRTGSPEVGSRSREGSKAESVDSCDEDTVLECTDSGIRLNGDSDIDTPTSVRQDMPTTDSMDPPTVVWVAQQPTLFVPPSSGTNPPTSEEAV